MNSKEALEKLINDIEEQGKIISTNNLIITFNINYEYVMGIYQNILKDLDRLEKLKKAIVSKKRIQSLRETANPIYEVVLHIPQNLFKEVLDNV